MPKINSLEVVHQDTNKDSYDNLHDLLVSLKGSANKEVIDGQARAAYETLLEMYVNDKEAFARRLETLTAEFGTSIANIIEEWTVYASATEAYARKIEEVSAKAFQNEAKVTEEMYARVTADEAVAKLVTTLRADFENAQTRSRASIREEQIARANADEALASRSFVMEASIADNTAMITEEQLVRATADEALASNITSLTATVATNTASILTEQTTRANADSALATQINTVSATASGKNRTYVQTTAPTGTTLVPLVAGDLWFDSDDNYKLYRYSGSSWSYVADQRIDVNTAAISTESTTRATADSALSSQITSVLAIANNNTAAINNEITARANGDSANATSISNVSARLDTGDFAAVKTQSSATATKVGNIEAKWGVTTNVNGYVAGIQLLNGGSTQSSFTVDATKFIVKKPDGTNGIVWNGAASRLDVSGDIYANNLYGTVVSTGNVIDNAINRPVTSSIGTTSVSNSEATYMTVSLTTTVASTIFASSSMGMGFPAGTNDSRFNLKINGNVVATMHTGSAYVQSIALSGALSVDAGTHTVQLTGWRSGAPTVEIESGTVYGVGIQK